MSTWHKRMLKPKAKKPTLENEVQVNEICQYPHKKDKFKVWQSVQWADTFPDEVITMETTDITPQYASNKITSLVETKRFDECCRFLAKVNTFIMKSILTDLPITQLHITVPHSLCVLDAIYKRVFDTCPNNFPIQYLRTDELLKNMVILFSQPPNSNNREKNCNTYFPYCRSILKIITTVEPNFHKMVKEKKKNLQQSLRHLGKHGLVKSGSGKQGHKMTSLHDALKFEFERGISIYKTALQKLEDASLCSKTPSESSVNYGPAPSQASHHRLLQVDRDNLQDRLIHNKTIYNAVEPAIFNQAMTKLINILEKRIEYDKMILFEECELRKLYGCDRGAYISVTLRQYSQGYTTLLHLINDACGVGEHGEVEDGGSWSDDDDDDDLYGSCGSISSQKIRTYSDDSTRGTDNSVRISRSLHPGFNSPLSAGFPRHHPRRKTSRDDSPVFTSLFNGEKHRKSSQSSTDNLPVPKPRLSRGSTSNSDGMTSSYVRLSDNQAPEENDDLVSLKKEVAQLQKELKESRDEIKRLKEREKSLRDRLSDHAQKQFAVSNSHFENLSLDSKRPTQLIRSYGNLYTDGRLDALDALDDLKGLEELSVLKTKILFSIIVLAFRSSEELLDNTKMKVREILNFTTTDKMSLDLQQHIDKYLQQTFDRFNVSSSVKNICEQIYETLYDYPCLRQCEGLVQFVEECLQISLGLSTQNPSYIISYTDNVFTRDRHTRFHTSDPGSDAIKNFVWPCLLEGENGICVSKGFVVT